MADGHCSTKEKNRTNRMFNAAMLLDCEMTAFDICIHLFFTELKWIFNLSKATQKTKKFNKNIYFPHDLDFFFNGGHFIFAMNPIAQIWKTKKYAVSARVYSSHSIVKYSCMFHSYTAQLYEMNKTTLAWNDMYRYRHSWRFASIDFNAIHFSFRFPFILTLCMKRVNGINATSSPS